MAAAGPDCWYGECPPVTRAHADAPGKPADSRNVGPQRNHAWAARHSHTAYYTLNVKFDSSTFRLKDIKMDNRQKLSQACLDNIDKWEIREYSGNVCDISYVDNDRIRVVCDNMWKPIAEFILRAVKNDVALGRALEYPSYPKSSDN